LPDKEEPVKVLKIDYTADDSSDDDDNSVDMVDDIVSGSESSSSCEIVVDDPAYVDRTRSVPAKKKPNPRARVPPSFMRIDNNPYVPAVNRPRPN
jgi:hypothetical protein